MKAVVLVGGYATRLRPISYVIAKPLFPMLGKPVIHRVLDSLHSLEVDEAILAVNYLSEQLQRVIGNRYRGIRIRYSIESSPLGTAGPIRLAFERDRPKETFIALNGDIIAQVDLAEMLKYHRIAGADVTDALHMVDDVTRFGAVTMDSSGRIRKFIEKPKQGQVRRSLCNAGIYLMEPHVIDMIRKGRRVSLEREIFPSLARKGRLYGYTFSGYWFDVGNLDDYRRAAFKILDAEAGGLVLREGATVTAKNVKVKGPIFLGRASRVSKGAMLGPYAIAGRRVRIDSKAKISRSILFDEVSVGEASTVTGAILGSKAVLGRRVKVEPQAVISPYVQVAENVRIGRGAIIHPYKEVKENVRAGANLM